MNALPEPELSPKGAPRGAHGRAGRPRLGSIFLTVCLDLVGFGLVLPFLAAEARTTFGAPAFVGALLGSAYSAMQFLFVPVWGRLSDRVGRKPVLVWSVAATAVGLVWLATSLAWGSSVGWLFAARIFSGIATANLGTASAYIADVTTREDRNKGMALIGVAFGLGFIIGPAIGGVLAQVTINGRHGPLACFVAAGLSVVNLVWVGLGLAESLPPEKRSQVSARSLTPMNPTALREAFAQPGVGRCVGVNFLILLAFTNLDQTMRYFNEDLFAMSMKATGGLLAFIGIVAAMTQGGLIRAVGKRVPEATLIRAGIVLQFVAFVGFALSPAFGRVALYASGALLAVGNGCTQPSILSLISKRAAATAQGGTLGTNQSFGSLARVFGPAMGGFVYGAIGPRAPFVMAALGMVVALCVALPLKGEPVVAPAK